MNKVKSSLISAIAIGSLAGSTVGVAAQEDGTTPGTAAGTAVATPVEVTGTLRGGNCSQTGAVGDETALPGANEQYTCTGTWSMSDPRISGRVTLVNDNVYLVANGLEASETLSSACAEDAECEVIDLETRHTAISVENADGAWRQRPLVELHFPGSTQPGRTVIVLDGEQGYAGLVAVLEAVEGEEATDYYGFILDARQLRPPPQIASHQGQPLTAAAEPAATITEVSVIEVAEVDDRTRDLTIESPSVGTRRVRLILPVSWDAQPDATWPVLYLLHGQGGDHTNWSVDTDVAPRLSKDLDVLMVMPDAGASYYSDWWNGGEGGDGNANAWETFHLTELPAILEADWRASERRAVAGLSMGGFGAMSYAARHPGFFLAAAAYSGVLDPLGSDWQHEYALWGDKVEQGDVWKAHDPVTLAAALEGTPLYVWYGDGTEEAGGPVVDSLESWLQGAQ